MRRGKNSLGWRAGDIRRAINEVPIADTADAEERLDDARRRLDLDVQRGTRRMSMRFRL